MDTKRAMDLVLGSYFLAAATPILMGIALAMRLSGDRGPFLYRARRFGEGGRIITILKVRTMVDGAGGSSVAGSRDPRVTPVGRLLRQSRLDELPQFVNVVRGDMSLVGPRPEDPEFVDLSNELHRRVFTARPGITGLTQLQFHDEGNLLNGPDADKRYRDEVRPAKLRLDAAYLDSRTIKGDIAILGRTVALLLTPRMVRETTENGHQGRQQPTSHNRIGSDDRCELA